MEAVGILAATLGFLISFAGLIYPFKPYKTRKRALVATILCFLLVGVFAETSGTEATQGPEKGWWTDQVKGNTEAEDLSDTSVTNVDRNDATGGVPQTATSTLNENEPEATRVPQGPSEADLRKLRNYFDARNWSQVIYQIMVFRKKGYEIGELVSELEQDTINIVKPLPSSDFEGNLGGYELLSVLRPENTSYEKKVADYKAKKKQARQAAVSRLRKKEDKVEGITWYQHPNEPRYLNSRSTVYLYIGRRGDHGAPTLRMKTVYAASNWLFVDNVIAWHDGIKEPFVSGYFERDNNSRIWEWRDDVPSGYQIEILKSLANAKEAILRFEGNQYRKDITLSAGDKKAIREVLLAYEVMKSGG